MRVLALLGFLTTSLLADVASLPFAKPSAGKNGGPKFEALSPERTGVSFANPIDTKHRDRRLYIGGYAAGGLAVGDVDGDGWLDLFAVGGPGKNALYLQDSKQPFRFREVTATVAGLDGGDNWGAGAVFVDIDNDTDLDLYICHHDAPNQLYINETKRPGAVIFTERAKEFGLDIVDASFMPYFADYDRDGDLDLFLATYQFYDPGGYPKETPVERKDGKYAIKPEATKYYGIVDGLDGKPMLTNVGRQDYLLQSNASEAKDGKIRFTNVTAKAGIAGIGVGNSAVWWDYNGDGWQDLYVANDFKQPDQLYRNNRDGTFTDMIREATAYTTWFSMGSDVCDINNDGRLDLLVSDMAGTTHYRSKVSMGEMGNSRQFLLTAEPRQFMRNTLFLGTGTPRFLEAAYMAGLANTDWTWSAKLADLDNDGWADAYFTNGAARMFNHSDHSPKNEAKIGKTDFDLWDHLGPRLEENLAYRNLGGLHFQNVGAEWGLARKSMSYGCVTADFDNDGDLDLVTADLDEPLAFYQNHTKDGKSIRVRLRGQKSNRHGWGAIVRVTTDAGMQTRLMNPVTGFMGCHEPDVHFGLGKASKVASLTVEWPNGRRTTATNLEAGNVHVITEEEGEPVEIDQSTLLFAMSRVVPAITHREQDFDDYKRQELLPAKHSQLGPGMAVGDVDGDGDDDFYMGRARGFPRAVYINEGQGRLKVVDPAPFAGDSAHEDLGCLFFDADRDGDLDLYVVSGSVECEPGDESLRDRLYVNDGKGKFTKIIGALPADERESGGVVCAADYDRDGDLDLFLGGRVVPGRYPETPRSFLLENRGEPGKPSLADATAKVSAELAKVGLVTSALWSDANGDGWPDLLVTLDWGAVRLFLNDAGRALKDATATTDLAERIGWWNGIDGADLDGDGDVDYVVTNFGANTTYHPSKEKPELLFYGDFDGSGHANIVEAKFEKDTLYPRRGLSCSSHAMPVIRDRLKTFHNFGMASLEEVYTEEKLSKAIRLEANGLHAGTLINLGKDAKTGVPKFAFRPLPTLGQISPSFGVALADFDADGVTDAFLAQNFYSPQPEVGRMAGGLSVFLRGRKGEEFGWEEAWPRRSGILIQGDAKAVSVTDFNEDGRPDLLVSVNNGVLQAYENIATGNNRPFRVKLQGKAGNPTGVGAKVRLHLADRTTTAWAEVRAGGGYLSQSSATIYFGLGEKGVAKEVEVLWPNGQTSKTEVPADAGGLRIAAP